MDCPIAALAIKHKVALLHKDSDFAIISHHFPLSSQPAYRRRRLVFLERRPTLVVCSLVDLPVAPVIAGTRLRLIRLLCQTLGTDLLAFRRRIHLTTAKAGC